MPKFVWSAVFSLCAALLSGCGGGSGGGDKLEVQVPGLGVLRGTPAQDVVNFKGIPFAKSPTGALRWQPPEVHGPWDSPRDASHYGASCRQASSAATPEYRGPSSEDCLFLNVATPASALQGGASLPVMLWIHGGGYQNGASNDYVYGTKADALAARASGQVVVVTVNYRLGVFGFLASAEIKASTADNSAGNFGIQDQRLAMAWVKDHIAAFGGNGQSITIFGESGGGNSVMNHLAQPRSFSYYTKAIIQSGTYDQGAIAMDTAEAHYQKLLTDTNCPDLACLRALDGDTLLDKGNAPGPVVDDIEMTATPTELIAQGQHNKVPVLIGANRDETLPGLINVNLTPDSEAAFDGLILAGIVNGVDSSNLAEVKELYDPSVYPYPADLGGYSRWTWTLGRMATDQVPGVGHCGARWLAQALVAGGVPSLYAYSFDHAPQKNLSSYDLFGFPGAVFSGHACDIPFTFANMELLVPGEEADLATSLSGHLIEFSKKGNPNTPGQDDWPQYTAQSDTVLRYKVASLGVSALCRICAKMRVTIGRQGLPTRPPARIGGRSSCDGPRCSAEASKMWPSS